METFAFVIHDCSLQNHHENAGERPTRMLLSAPVSHSFSIINPAIILSKYVAILDNKPLLTGTAYLHV
jgi:hypothetical protein